MLSLPLDICWLLVSFLDVCGVAALRHTCGSFLRRISTPKLEFLQKHGTSANLWQLVIQRGWVDVVPAMLSTPRFKCLIGSSEIYETLVDCGHLAVVQWACQPHTDIDVCVWDDELFLLAAKKGRFDILMWMTENGFPCVPQTCFYAAEGGQINVLGWLRNERDYVASVEDRARCLGESFVCPWSGAVCAAAAAGGHLETLMWLRDAHERTVVCPWDSTTCANAARYGHLDILQWCILNGCLWGASVCSSAALGGNIEILSWLRGEDGNSQVCPWDEFTCAAAAYAGYLDVLKWLRNDARLHGICPWDKRTRLNAEKYGHHDVLEWLLKNGCP